MPERIGDERMARAEVTQETHTKQLSSQEMELFQLRREFEDYRRMQEERRVTFVTDAEKRYVRYDIVVAIVFAAMAIIVAGKFKDVFLGRLDGAPVTIRYNSNANAGERK